MKQITKIYEITVKGDTLKECEETFSMIKSIYPIDIRELKPKLNTLKLKDIIHHEAAVKDGLGNYYFRGINKVVKAISNNFGRLVEVKR